MTIRFVQQWNGYSPDTIVTLAGAEETRLIGLGYAVTDLDGPGNTPLPVTSTTNLTGRSVFLTEFAHVSAMDMALQSPVLAKKLAAVKAGTEDLIIVVRGDSLFAGNNTSRSSSFAYRLGEYLRELGYPCSNDFVAASNTSGGNATIANVEAYYAGALTFDNADWMSGVPNIGFGGTSLNNLQVGSVTGMTWQPELDYDTLIVGAIGYSSGCQCAVFKGGVSVGANLDTYNAAAIEKTVTYSALSDKTNAPVRLVKAAGTGTLLQLNFIWCKSSTQKRVYIINAARGGAKITDLASSTYLFGERAVINNQIQPHVTINHIGVNDSIAGTVAGTFQADAVTLMEEDMMTYGRDALWATPAPVGSAVAALATQKGIANAVRAACADTGAPLIVDLYSIMKSQAYNDALYLVDNLHWTSAGDAFVTNHLLNGMKI